MRSPITRSWWRLTPRRPRRRAGAWFISALPITRRCCRRSPASSSTTWIPTCGFEAFVRSVHAVIETAGRGTLYVFDCLSHLAETWGSDQSLGNFFLLTCPRLLGPGDGDLLRHLPRPALGLRAGADPQHDAVHAGRVPAGRAALHPAGQGPAPVAGRDEHAARAQRRGVPAGEGKRGAGPHPVAHPMAAPAKRPAGGLLAAALPRGRDGGRGMPREPLPAGAAGGDAAPGALGAARASLRNRRRWWNAF